MFDAMPTELAEQLLVVVKKVEFSPDYIPAAAPVWPAPGFVAAAKPDADAKPKRVLSEEHLAKMKAGREAAKLKKQLAAAEPPAAAPVVAAPTPVAAPVPETVAAPEAKPKRVLSPEHLAKLKAGREAAAAKKAAAPEPAVAAPMPVVAAPAPDMTALMAEFERLRIAVAQATAPAPVAAPMPMAAPVPSSMMVEDSQPESGAETDAEPVVTPPIKKRVLSPEHLAKMKAGRAAKKAEKAAAAMAVGMAAPIPVAAAKTKTA